MSEGIGISRKGKSVQEVSKHHGRTDVRYWQPKVFKPWYTRNGERREVDHYAVKIQYRGRREKHQPGNAEQDGSGGARAGFLRGSDAKRLDNGFGEARAGRA
jgi:hypothetical protein